MKKNSCCNELKTKIALLEEKEFLKERDKDWERSIGGNYIYSRDYFDSNSRVFWGVKESYDPTRYAVYFCEQKDNETDTRIEKFYVDKTVLMSNKLFYKALFIGFLLGAFVSLVLWGLL